MVVTCRRDCLRSSVPASLHLCVGPQCACHAHHDDACKHARFMTLPALHRTWTTGQTAVQPRQSPYMMWAHQRARPTTLFCTRSLRHGRSPRLRTTPGAQGELPAVACNCKRSLRSAWEMRYQAWAHRRAAEAVRPAPTRLQGNPSTWVDVRWLPDKSYLILAFRASPSP